MEEKNVLQEASEAIGHDFTVAIEENVMHITPADAGIALLGYIRLTEETFLDYEKNVDRLANELLDKADDNAALRGLLDNLIPVLETLGYAELVEEINNTMYRVRGINGSADVHLDDTGEQSLS